MMTKHYKVAGHTFAVSGQAGFFELMGNYEPFECEGGEPLFSLTVECGVVPEYTEEYRQEESRGTIIYSYGHDASGNYVFEEIRKESKGCLICSKDCREGRLIMTSDITTIIFERLLMIMYALATAGNDTLLLHAVVVSCEGKGYLLLGHGGTGKSTHARLWLLNVEGTKLVNDDFPVVRDGVVYGSPWSPITPCYRNVNYPIGGMVSLSQAPYNRIHRISGIEAYLTLYCRDFISCLGYPIPEDIAEGMHQTKDRLAQTIPMWHLECLPDEAAARLCHETICETI
ncbi:MAG: hypothetical protein II047_08670 [Bacteroidales bacterium]|nr:hypothetical protein [Bacteroidales bacterium]